MIDMLGLFVTCCIIVALGAYVAGPSGFGFTFVMCLWFFLYVLSQTLTKNKRETYKWEIEVGKREKTWINEDGSYDWSKYPHEIGSCLLNDKERAMYMTWILRQPPDVYKKIMGEEKCGK